MLSYNLKEKQKFILKNFLKEKKEIEKTIALLKKSKDFNNN